MKIILTNNDIMEILTKHIADFINQPLKPIEIDVNIEGEELTAVYTVVPEKSSGIDDDTIKSMERSIQKEIQKLAEELPEELEEITDDREVYGDKAYTTKLESEEVSLQESLSKAFPVGGTA
jgi:hypothetical protein